MRVIDISGHQQGINLAAVPCDGVVIKATEGQGWRSPTLVEQVEGARKAKKKVAFYHFVSTGNTPAQEAANFVSVVKPIDAGDPVVLDWEQSWDATVPRWCAEWWDRVADALGRSPFMYLNLSTARRPEWGWALRERAGLWLAQYPISGTIAGWGITSDTAMHSHGRPQLIRDTPGGWDVAMWQFTNKGRLTGYEGNLDLNEGSLWKEQQ